MSARWVRGKFKITFVYRGVTLEVEADGWRGSPWERGADGLPTFDMDEPNGNVTFWNGEGLLAVQVVAIPAGGES